MNPGTIKLLMVLGLLVLALLATMAGVGYRLTRTEEACWKHEAADAFQKYGSFKARIEILRIAGIEKDPRSNPVEVIEKDPNGCSLGSNGQTILRFSFDDRNDLTTIQVFRNYVASNYQMALIEERRY
jgi:hypothetical protein